jgi:RNA-directed DNA polymerase
VNLMPLIASDEVLEQAFDWLCKRRRQWSHNDEVWEVRQRWADIKPALQEALLAGGYCFSALRRIHRREGDIEVWSALDALVLKAMAIVLTKYLSARLSRCCCHVAGNGGAKAAVRFVLSKLSQNRYVFRTDVQSYYASIDHDILFAQAKRHIDDPCVLNLLWEYLRRTVYDDGLYEEIRHGISLGCPLSPLMGALFLDVLDRRMETTGLDYVRFMDDWVVLAPSRWKLRKAIKIVNQTLAELKVRQHPDKTFIGRIDRRFDFLGYRFHPDRLTIAEKTRKNFVDKVRQLYEQGADSVRIGEYVRRWMAWVNAGIWRRVGSQLFRNLADPSPPLAAVSR